MCVGVYVGTHKSRIWWAGGRGQKTDGVWNLPALLSPWLFVWVVGRVVTGAETLPPCTVSVLMGAWRSVGIALFIQTWYPSWCSGIKKEQNNAICSNMDGPRDYHTKWRKLGRERQIPYDIAYIWNLKYDTGTSLVVQWLRICLPMQGTWVKPWSGKIPHAADQLSPCATTTETAL